MVIDVFPPVENADQDGLLAIGGDLEVPTLVNAYTQGIFPWPISPSIPIAWFSPDPRGILDYSDLHISRKLMRELKSMNEKWNVTFNKSFPEVIHHCAISRNRKGQDNQTWITNDIIKSYISLFHAGHAYSVEVWNDGDLAGGMYGVCISRFVSGESMFYLESNASKFALISLMEKLQEFNINWIDTQMVTPVVSSLGGKEIERKEFMERLSRSIPVGPLSSPLRKSAHQGTP